MWPPRRLMYRSKPTKLLGGEKFTKHHRGDKSQQTDPASPHRSLYLNLSRPAGRRGSSGEYDTARLQVTDMSHHLKPCGTIIPLSLWREKGGGGEGETERTNERASERSGGVVGAGRCFTPGLFKETAQGMPLALLTKHFSLSLPLSLFCLFVFSWVLLGALQSNPLGPSLPPQPFEDASETFSQTFGPVSVLMFQMNNPRLLRPRRGLLGERGWMAV